MGKYLPLFQLPKPVSSIAASHLQKELQNQNNDFGKVKQPLIKLPSPVANVPVSNVKNEPQNDNFDSSNQSMIKKEPIENLETEQNVPITMVKGFVFPKPVPSVIN